MKLVTGEVPSIVVFINYFNPNVQKNIFLCQLQLFPGGNPPKTIRLRNRSGAQIQDWTYQNHAQVSAQVLMGAALLRKYRNGTVSTDYPTPTLVRGCCLLFERDLVGSWFVGWGCTCYLCWFPLPIRYAVAYYDASIPPPLPRASAGLWTGCSGSPGTPRTTTPTMTTAAPGGTWTFPLCTATSTSFWHFGDHFSRISSSTPLHMRRAVCSE